MIKKDFDPKDFLATAPDDVRKEWEDLIERAAIATENTIRAWENHRAEVIKWEQLPPAEKSEQPRPKFDPGFDPEVWRGFRNWMGKNIFNNKCAYCETTFVGFIPDAEHFRPKGLVLDSKRALSEDETDTSGKVHIIDEDGKEVAHPGYFWLAYNWKNLLPSCNTCNRYKGKKAYFPARHHFSYARLTEKEIKKLRSKEIRWPIENDIYFFFQPEDLDDKEERLLLHPFFEPDPYDHLEFEKDGTAKPKNGSELGAESIRVFDLNDENKQKARYAQQVTALKLFLLQVASVDNDKSKEAGEAFLRQYFKGTNPYAAAVFDYVVNQMGTSCFTPSRDRLIS